MPPVTFRCLASEDERRSIAAEVSDHRTLGDVVAWGFASKPERPVRAVIAQDEFTRDVVVRYRDSGEHAIWLVYDTT